MISKKELHYQTCKECYLYNKEYCKPDGLVLFDATTCKNYHTEESFKSFLEYYKKLTGSDYVKATKNIFE